MEIKDISPKATPKRMNRMMESRFGFALDYSKLSLTKARKLNQSITENINRIRKSYGVHTAEKNPKYMELLLVREALTKWIKEQKLTEGKLEAAEVALAAKDMVDSIQDMLEKVSKMQVEQMPALIDTIRGQIGNDQAEAFKNSMGQLLTGMVDQLTQAREQADTAARQLAGDETAVAGGMAMPGAAPAAPITPGLAGAEPTVEPTPEPDQFAATDAAAGGPEAMGRETR